MSSLEAPLGFPFYYRLLLRTSYLCVAGFIMYRGYEGYGPGWLLIGAPFAFVGGILAQAAILRTFTPKLEAYAEGETWIKLN